MDSLCDTAELHINQSVLPPSTAPRSASTFLSYLHDQPSTQGWHSPQNWLGSKPRQAAELPVSSGQGGTRDGDLGLSHTAQDGLLLPAWDAGRPEALLSHFRSSQPFEKGLGFQHRPPELREWEEARLRGQVGTRGRGSQQPGQPQALGSLMEVTSGFSHVLSLCFHHQIQSVMKHCGALAPPLARALHCSMSPE